jgi:hypothetical protein
MIGSRNMGAGGADRQLSKSGYCWFVLQSAYREVWGVNTPAELPPPRLRYLREALPFLLLLPSSSSTEPKERADAYDDDQEDSSRDQAPLAVMATTDAPRPSGFHHIVAPTPAAVLAVASAVRHAVFTVDMLLAKRLSVTTM